MNDNTTAPAPTDEQDTDCGNSNDSPHRIRRILDWLNNREMLGKWMLALTVLLFTSIIVIHVSSPGWIFSVNARSRIVDLVTPQKSEIRWRVDGSLICVDRKVALPDTLFTQAGDSRALCGGKRWTGYRALDPEQVLILTGNLKVTLELRDNRTLFMALRNPGEVNTDGESRTGNGASLSFTHGHKDIPLAVDGRLRVNLLFPAVQDESLAERIFPFKATTTIGRDINWAGSRLLTEGTIDVYSIDESPDQRRKVDSTDLMMGDQLRLLPTTGGRQAIFPKGFVRLSAGSDALDIIAFGAARRLRIDRYGENGYEFKPGIWESLVNNSHVQMALSIYIGIVSVVTAIASVCGSRK